MTVLLAASTVLAADGVVLTQRTTTPDGSSTSRTVVSQGRLRIESGSAGQRLITLVDPERDVILHLDEARRTFREMPAGLHRAGTAPGPAETAAMMARAEDAMKQAQESMRKSLERLPPDARARMEQQMAQARVAQAPAATPPEFRAVGTGVVGSWPCDQLDGYRDGRKAIEVCVVASLTTLGIGDADARTLMQIPALLVGPADERTLRARQRELVGYDGYALRTVVLDRNETTEIVSVMRGDVPDTDFHVPPGYAAATGDR